ncbi:MAG: hypothetical protein AB1461_17830 [Thermodesulfobacteriota bacterium]
MNIPRRRQTDEPPQFFALAGLAFLGLRRPGKSAAATPAPLFAWHTAGFQYYAGPKIIC